MPFHTEIGKLPEHPEPTPANLVDFKQFLTDKKIDVGFAVDPDADRCVIVDEHGVPILEELTLAICIQYVLSQDPSAKEVVKNCSSSLSDDAVCKKFGVHITETAVGEVNVALKMKELGSRIGGEGNGGIIFRDAHLGRDSVCAICLVLSAMATTGKAIGDIVREIP